ncbi:5,10-methylenetetrahydromethanopterin reductase [Thermocatellispora tengchongensis]|uniref:5,10-methylenetetrahydromethanopterin reductase n=1 Tax=Thermocatellispora tengchongensis TaxID=1073253 RepID=A0A840P7Q4_9ACTN|nr:LLM class flavin-dependent oxidoreductase [Thermocatellispora tengchongensis]MBB5135698.1 5,10-methylenetetrahydromethanopterin reductase [Thermocatellispora tengchongensis]
MAEGPIFSVRVGAGAGGIAGVTEAAVRAEAMGFDQVWTGNDLFGGPGVASMAAMLAATERIKVGSGVLDPVSIHPVQLAQLASGFQELSGGRFILGLGAGSDVFFRRAGIAAPRPVPRTRTAVVAIRALTDGRSPAGLPGAGEGWHESAHIESPRPVPIYVGAMGPKMLEMAGRHADGVLPLCLPPRQVFDAMEQIGRGAKAAGRTVADLDIAACVWCSLDEDRDRARRVLARFIARYSGSLSADALAAHGLDPEEFARTQALVDDGRLDEATEAVLSSPSMLTLGIVGGAHDVLEQCEELLAAGARHISFGPPLGPDPGHAMGIFGERVLPRLRATP